VKVAIKRVAVFLIWPAIVGLLGAIFHPPFMPYEIFCLISGAFWGVIMSLMAWPHIK